MVGCNQHYQWDYQQKAKLYECILYCIHCSVYIVVYTVYV